MQASFEIPADGAFCSRYQRNNKKGGVKNLRCFPLCANSEHARGAPCTGPVLVNLKTSNMGTLVSFARFRLHNPTPDETSEIDLIPYELSKVYSKSMIESKLRTRSNPLGRNFRSELKTDHIMDKTHRECKFEFKERGWHYGWTGGRYKTDQKHYLEIAVFDEKTPGNLTCVHLLKSSLFGVYSSRRSSPDDKIKRRKGNKNKAMNGIKEEPKRVAAPTAASENMYKRAFSNNSNFNGSNNSILLKEEPNRKRAKQDIGRTPSGRGYDVDNAIPLLDWQMNGSASSLNINSGVSQNGGVDAFLPPMTDNYFDQEALEDEFDHSSFESGQEGSDDNHNTFYAPTSPYSDYDDVTAQTPPATTDVEEVIVKTADERIADQYDDRMLFDCDPLWQAKQRQSLMQLNTTTASDEAKENTVNDITASKMINVKSPKQALNIESNKAKSSGGGSFLARLFRSMLCISAKQ